MDKFERGKNVTIARVLNDWLCGNEVIFLYSTNVIEVKCKGEHTSQVAAAAAAVRDKSIFRAGGARVICSS